MKNALLVLCAFLTLATASSYAATPNRKVKCPNYIADKRTGTYQKSGTSSSSKFECYAAEKDAKTRGYNTEKTVKASDFSKWWRLRLSTVKDTCGNYVAKNGPVLFLQIKQNGQAVFGDFCPSLGLLHGARNSLGFTASSVEIVNELDNPLGCANGRVEKTQVLELSQMFNKKRAYSVRYVTVSRCPNADEGYKTCTTDFSGVAFPETHKIWPGISSNPSEFGGSCGMALQTCAVCHPSLAGINEN